MACGMERKGKEKRKERKGKEKKNIECYYDYMILFLPK